MARTVGADKERTHDRIVHAAAKAIRKKGYADTSVADVMKDAGLTHGGFYAHFPSREAMLAEGLDCAARESVAALVGDASVLSANKGIDMLEALVDGYLAESHVRDQENGCTLSLLGSETRRQSPKIRHVATSHLKELAAAVAQHTDEPLATMSTLVGAMVIARLVDDPKLRKDVLAAARKAALAR